jgi:Flp pilus assembly protein TadD
VSNSGRLDLLRRLVQTDPTSIAFAQLAEECRREGRFAEAVEVCRHGLAVHPGYLSARVTLGRALVGLGQFDQAQVELQSVVDVAPGHLTAIRALADLFQRRGQVQEALGQFRLALTLAPNDPLLQYAADMLSEGVQQASPSLPDGRAQRTVVALERYLAAVHVARASRPA